jgi:phosphate transport system protein
MAEQPSNSERLLYLLFAGHNLERVADRVTNLAERVVFMTSGKMTELNPERIEPGGLE